MPTKEIVETNMASNIPDSANSRADYVVRRREKLFQEVKDKFFIDVKCNEFLDVQESVETYLKRLMAAIHGSEYRIEEKLVAGGSVVENVRLWEPTNTEITEEINPSSLPDYFAELDYLAIMSGDGIEFKNNRTPCPGCIFVTKGNEKRRPFFCKLMFCKTVYDVISNRDSHLQAQFLWKNGITDDSDVYTYWRRQLSNLSANAPHRVIEANSGSLVLISLNGHRPGEGNYYEELPLKFIWISKDQHQGIQKNCGGFGDGVFCVHVDFLPAFEIQRDPNLKRDASVSKMLQKSNIRNLSSTHIRYIVPRCSKQCVEGECWMVSTMLPELELIRGSSENHKESYKLFKFFVKQSHLSLICTSYMLKTVFLHHLQECAGSEKSVSSCIYSMLDMLYRMRNNRCIPHCFYKYKMSPLGYYPTGWNSNGAGKMFCNRYHVRNFVRKAYYTIEYRSPQDGKMLPRHALLMRFIQLGRDRNYRTAPKLSKVLPWP